MVSSFFSLLNVKLPRIGRSDRLILFLAFLVKMDLKGSSIFLSEMQRLISITLISAGGLDRDSQYLIFISKEHLP